MTLKNQKWGHHDPISFVGHVPHVLRVVEAHSFLIPEVFQAVADKSPHVFPKSSIALMCLAVPASLLHNCFSPGKATA